MFLSFIIPVYNVEKYVEECLTSCLKQNISKDEYEIICINDGSTDNSVSIIKRMEENYPNIRVITQSNSGLSAARNVGIDNSQGDYLWFLDSDDFILPNILLDLYKITQKTRKDQYLFHSYFFWNQMTESEREDALKERLESNETFSGLWTRIISKKIIGDLRFPVGTCYGEDIIFIRALELKHPINEEIDRVWHFYRENAFSLTNRKGNYYERADAYMLGAVAMDEIYKTEGGRVEANANILMNHIWRAMWNVAHLEKSERNSLLKKWKAKEMFPYKKPPQCTTKSAHLTTRTGISGKIFNWITTNSNTIFGFYVLLTYVKLRKLRKPVL